MHFYGYYGRLMTKKEDNKFSWFFYIYNLFIFLFLFIIFFYYLYNYLQMRPRWVAKLILLGEGMTARGTLTCLKSEQVWNQLSYTWAAAMPCVNTGWVMNRLREALRRRTWEYNGWKTSHDLEMCDVSMESQLRPGQHQKNCGQQVEGGDSFT